MKGMCLEKLYIRRGRYQLSSQRYLFSLQCGHCHSKIVTSAFAPLDCYKPIRVHLMKNDPEFDYAMSVGGIMPRNRTCKGQFWDQRGSKGSADTKELCEARSLKLINKRPLILWMADIGCCLMFMWLIRHVWDSKVMNPVPLCDSPRHIWLQVQFPFLLPSCYQFTSRVPLTDSMRFRVQLHAGPPFRRFQQYFVLFFGLLKLELLPLSLC